MSNQLGTRFFLEHGAAINALSPSATARRSHPALFKLPP